MSVDPDLKRKLAALTSELTFENGAQVVSKGPGRVALSAVMQAIDTVMLPRNLTFAVGDTAVKVNASGRRLRALLRVEGAVSAPSEILGSILSQDAPQTVDAVGVVLRSLSELPGTLTMTSEAAEPLGGASDAGLPVSELVAHWGIDLDAKPPAPIEVLCLSLGPDLLAMALIKEGSVAKALGEPTMAQALETLWLEQTAAFEQEFATLLDTQGKNFFVLRQGALAAGALLCLVNLNKAKVLVAVRAASFARVVAAWRAATHA